MAHPLAGWRLPLRLAMRDLVRYKGRSVLAALLIFLPVFVMAAALTALTTFNLDDRERAQAAFQGGVRATVSFGVALDETKVQPFPASGRAVTYDRPPTTAEVAQQAERPVAAIRSFEGYIERADTGTYFPSVFAPMMFADLHSPVLNKLATLVDGRLPSKPGEVAITDYGSILGVPHSGKITISVYGTHPTAVTVVGRVRTPIRETAVIGFPDSAPPEGASLEFALGGSTPVDAAMITTWRRYGAAVTAPSTVPTPQSGLPGTSAVAIAVGTMSFIVVVALLAGPAFAAGATRHRRTLGLFGANGAPRSVLRRIIFAQALTLGALTALVATLLGALAGVIGARYVRVHRYGFEPPVDIRVRWLVGLVLVATLASLVAAAVPARVVGRTNLLQALRGQVSSRSVRRRMPLLGLVAMLVGGTLLFQSVAHKNGDDFPGGSTVQLLLVYLGMPVFFGGAVMTVPYVLRMTGALAGHLPVAGRIAVRDVSRLRTRATASVGAVLATVAVCASALVLGASLDGYAAKRYAPSYPAGSGAFVSRSFGDPNSTSGAASQDAIDKIRTAAPGATAWWSTSEGLYASCAAASVAGPEGLLVHAVDEDGIDGLNLTAAQRAALNNGGVIVLTGPTTNSDDGYASTPLGYGASLTANSVKGGKVDVVRATQASDGTTSSCKKISLPATTGSPTTITHGYTILGSALLVKRSALTSMGLHAPLTAVTVPWHGDMSTRTQRQLQALTPRGMEFSVERGYDSPMAAVLAALTAAFALIVLLTTVVSTLLNDAESRADAATLATVGAPSGMRRRITGAHAAAIGVIGAATGIVIGIVPGLVLAREATGHTYDEHGVHSEPGTYVIPWWPLIIMLVGVPLLAAAISMIFARRTPPLTRREA